jgi:putative RNA 2'-phosphotransferase
MGRQYVHLATEPELALQVGRRKARAPELLVVDALAAHRAGTAFYRRSDVVWLADKVASSFISCQE